MKTGNRAKAIPAWAIAAAVALGAVAAAAEPPVNITAEKMEYFSEQNLVVFTGKAIAVREDVTLSSDRMEVTLSEGAESGQSGSVRRIVATGNVQFRQEDETAGRERYATGEKGEYDGESNVVVLTGQPKVWERQNVITGTVMKFFIDEHRFVAEGGGRTPVGLTIYPEKDDGAKE